MDEGGRERGRRGRRRWRATKEGWNAMPWDGWESKCGAKEGMHDSLVPLDRVLLGVLELEPFARIEKLENRTERALQCS